MLSKFIFHLKHIWYHIICGRKYQIKLQICTYRSRYSKWGQHQFKYVAGYGINSDDNSIYLYWTRYHGKAQYFSYVQVQKLVPHIIRNMIHSKHGEIHGISVL